MTNRYQKEIEEILKKAGESPPEPDQSPAPDNPPPERRRRRPRFALRSLPFDSRHVMLSGIIALIISIFFGGLPMFFAGLSLLGAGYVMFYRELRPGKSKTSSSEGGRPPKVWRGRTIDPGDDPHFTEDIWGRRR